MGTVSVFRPREIPSDLMKKTVRHLEDPDIEQNAEAGWAFALTPLEVTVFYEWQEATHATDWGKDC